ncbi:MAG: hypothetical protein J0I41_22510 [Filimonas sp.]|nr:hypothetical protein [Filimonas sp.]
MPAFEFDTPLIDNKPAAFVTEIKLDDAILALQDAWPCTLYLFGGKIASPTPNYPDAHRLAFTIVEKRENREFVFHELEQRTISTMFVTPDEKDRSEMVDMLKPAQLPSLHRKPKWKVYDGQWPFHEDKPYHFIKQFFFDRSFKNTVSWDFSIYLFSFFTPEKLHLQIFTQDMNEQTAEDHYRLEEMMATFDADLKDHNKVETLIKTGDKFFQEYVLEHPKCDNAIIALIAQYGKTKKLKDAAKKRISNKQ